MSDEIKIETGPKREFSTGATKQAATGKGRPSLVPGDVILEVSKHFEEGVPIHGARNWEKGIPLSVILDSLERHLQQLKMGMTDEPHARALVWNAMVYFATKLRIESRLLPAELNDMPEYIPAKTKLIGKEITNPDHPDYKWFCDELRCYEKGRANSGKKHYRCPEHKKGA